MKALLSNSPPLTAFSLYRTPTSIPRSPASLILRSPNGVRERRHTSRPRPNSQSSNDTDPEVVVVEDLKVPHHWSGPSKATEESEWLRMALHKWLDDEYCPEATNVEISKVAAESYRRSLTEKQRDLGEILLRMAGELEAISYEESFHGAFSSANAEISLIADRIDHQQR